MPVGKRLRYSRERAGLTLRQVEERTGIGESSLSEFETAKREPRVSQLQLLACVYQRSVDFFLSDAPISENVVLWRQRPGSPLAEEVAGEFLALSQQYHNLESWLSDCRDPQLPHAAGDAASYSYSDAANLAHHIRRSLALGDRPALTLLSTLEENCGVKIFHKAFEPSGSAACCRSEAFGAAVLLNANNVRWRRNFDLAHELFHLLTWHIFRRMQDESQVEASDEEERFATCFASNLLMPTDAIRAALDGVIAGGKIPLADMFDIARQFDVSVEALIWRMAFLKYFNYDDAPATIGRYKAVAALWEGDREHDCPPLRPARYRALAIRALRQGEISSGRFAEYLGISRRQARAFVDQDAGRDEEISVALA